MKHAGTPFQQRALFVAITFAIAAPPARAATIAVDSSDDSASSTACNLRKALASVNAAAAVADCAVRATGSFGSNDTVTFASLTGSTVTLSQGQLTITKPVTIEGHNLTIDANHASNAMYVQYAGLTLNDALIRNGANAYQAGGINVTGGTMQLNRVEMSNNQGGNGGAIEAFSVVSGQGLVLNDSNLHDNQAYSGAAIFGQNSTLALNGTSIHDNGAQNTGGAVEVDGGSLVVTNCLIVGNSAGTGGAIGNSGTVQIAGSVLMDNVASTFGGAITFGGSNGTVTIDESTLSGNSAANGGAIGTSTGGTLVMNNSTVAGNSATGTGGAVYGHKYPHLTLTNVTIAGNTAGNGGGLFFTADGNYGTTTLAFSNDIFSGNTAGTANDIGGTFPVPTGSNNLFGSALNAAPLNDSGNHNLFADTPGLGPLQDNGGPTDTRALLAGSPAIDAGSDSAAAALTTDQRGLGFARMAGASVDIGAFEYLGDRIFAAGFEASP
ncbi:MAG TPA: choice-of-anchor Q domain-containing protein [Rudaea sp.]|jgi:hypothetical protein